MEQMFLLLTLALNFSQSHQYCMLDSCLGTGYIRYNCADFSYDLVLSLRGNNFTAYPVCGYLNHFNHAIVGVDLNGSEILIEPQTGQIVSDNYLLRPHHCMVRGLF